MDRAAELMRELEPFQKKCTEEGRPVEISLEETFPGDISTSFFVHVTAAWIGTMTCYAAITILSEILWQTTDIPVRRKVFSFKVHVTKEDPHYFDLITT